MHQNKNPYLQLTLIFLCLFIISCNNTSPANPGELVKDPDQMDATATISIQSILEKAIAENGKIDDTTKLHFAAVVKNFYETSDFEPLWSSKEDWVPLADSLLNTIYNAELEGLFPKDYHYRNLKLLKTTFKTDSLKKMDADLWAKADILLTDAFMRLIKDLKYGRLKADSITLNPDSTIVTDFYIKNLKALTEKKQYTSLLNSLQPKHKGYWELKKGIKRFTDSMDRRTYSYVIYPYKKGDTKDSLYFVKILGKRLAESGISSESMPDSSSLADAVKKYQKQRGLKVDGKISSALVKSMNISDTERFKRIAITLDRYKQLPSKMPEKYIWVNIPGYYLSVVQKDTIAFESKVIVGKIETRTPVLNSEITDMVTYPTWTVPTSIIVKQYLPKLKNNPGYLSRLGLRLVNSKGETINAFSVNWSKYSKGIPYRVMQGSGDNNALGIFKFNFKNPYAVYLHDTNQRYLFKNGYRALSHGCVRVQDWEKLAIYITQNDSINLKIGDTLQYTADSIKNWVAAKEHRRLEVKNKIPIYIRYFSCEGIEGKIKFFEDIYGEDKALREKYFTDK